MLWLCCHSGQCDGGDDDVPCSAVARLAHAGQSEVEAAAYIVAEWLQLTECAYGAYTEFEAVKSGLLSEPDLVRIFRVANDEAGSA